ncbi:MAG: helix-turn-helix domain-containing protein [Mycobacteriales bacterium]
MAAYGQYCPISRCAELLGDRWTIHIVRDLLTGTSRYNELIRGNPGLSRALLSKRLRQLRAAGVIEQTAEGTYVLTESGRALEPIVFGLAAWGAQWMFGDPQPAELDPDLLLWWLHRQLDPADLPGPRFTIYVPFTDHPKRYWIVVEQEPSLCLVDPGFDVDVTLSSDLWSLYRTYLGHQSLLAAQRSGDVAVSGSKSAVHAFFAAFRPSPVASLVASGQASRV